MPWSDMVLNPSAWAFVVACADRAVEAFMVLLILLSLCRVVVERKGGRDVQFAIASAPSGQ